MYGRRINILAIFLAIGLNFSVQLRGSSFVDSWSVSCLRPYLAQGEDGVASVPWDLCLGRIEDRKIRYFLSQGYYQEAIWFLEESGLFQQANLVYWFLHTIMTDTIIDKNNIKKLGMGGATKPKSVSLPLGIRGVFKKKKSMHPSSDYKSEIAAYHFDRMFGFRLVPMTVRRVVKGVPGSMQYFIKGATPVSKIPGYQRSKNLNVFDYLISNKDRNGENILVAWDREIGIDHGLSLRGANILGRFLKNTDKINNSLGIVYHPIRQVIVHPTTHIREFQASAHILSRLEKASLDDLKAGLSEYISDSKIYRIFDKKNRLIALLRQASLWNPSSF